MKKLFVCFLVLISLLFIGCLNNPFEETTINVYNNCAWQLSLEVTGGNYAKSFTVGESPVKITVPFDVEYSVRINSPYDTTTKVISVTPRMFTSTWAISWSSYKASYELEQY